MTAAELAALMGPVARELLGEPNPTLSNGRDLRFGTRGSLSVNLDRGLWHDHEKGEGGGVLDLIRRQLHVANGGAMRWLEENGYAEPTARKAGFAERIVATYRYQNADGSRAFDVVRLRDPKDFLQRAPDGTWKVKGIRKVLYQLPRLVEAPEGALVFVVEGEKDVDRLLGLGLRATTSSGGAGKWLDGFADGLGHLRVAAIPDNDAAGEKYAAAVVASFRRRNVPAAVLRLPGLPRKGDVSDWLAGGGTADSLVELAEAALLQDGAQPGGNGPGPEPEPEAEASDAKAEKKPAKSAATVLVELAQNLYTFAADGTGEPFGVPRSGPKVVQMLRGGKTSLRNQLSKTYFRHTGKAAPQQALADALLVLEGIAQDADPQDLHLRVARHDAALWLDLGDATGRAARITGDGWTVEPRAPVLFKRTALTAELPEPVHGGSLDELWAWLNVEDEDRPLVLGWLIAILHPDFPHPILSIGGEQGSGKSTAEKVLVSLIDPSPVPLRKPPRDTESWVTAASGSWVVGIDNLSLVPDWLSDAFCRAVTGDGDVRRRLYTDGGMHVFAFRRCLLLNGIDIGAVRGDLADRLLSIGFRNIPEQDRLTETEIWSRWDAVHPRLLGALLCEAARNAGALPSVRLGRKPRMADFANVLAAVDEVHGTAGLARYIRKQNETAADSLTADAFVTAIAALGHFTGTSATLLERVSTPEKIPRGWPSNARAVTQLLKRQAPVMRRAGWMVSNDDGQNHGNVVIWTVIPPEIARNSSSQRSHASHDREDARDARQEYGPSQDARADICAQCGKPGADMESTDGTLTGRLHRGCFDAWFEATNPKPTRKGPAT